MCSVNTQVNIHPAHKNTCTDMSSAAFAAATRGRRKPLHSSASLNRTEAAAAVAVAAASAYAPAAFPDYAQLTREAEAYETARAARDARLVTDASSLIITFPGSALRELDTWCARLQMLTCALSTASEFSVAHAALRQQLVDATAFALKWQETRACAGTLIESVVGLDIDSRARLQARTRLTLLHVLCREVVAVSGAAMLKPRALISTNNKVKLHVYLCMHACGGPNCKDMARHRRMRTWWGGGRKASHPQQRTTGGNV
jgi:hypothetical protein